MGAPADEWNEAAARLRELPPLKRRQSPDFATLYRLAAEHGAKRLAGVRIDADTARDIVLKLVVQKLDALVDASEPFPFFLASVRHAGIDWLRKKGSRVVAEPKVERVEVPADSLEKSAELKLVLSHLTPLEQEVFALEAAGDDHTTIGQAIGKKRDAVAQIVSRARKKLRERGVM